MRGPALDPRSDLGRFATLAGDADSRAHDARSPEEAERHGAGRPERAGAGEQRLPEWLDLGTSVMLAELVATPPTSGAAEQLSLDVLVDDGRWMRQHVQRQLDSLQRWLGKRQEKLYEGRNAAPGPETIVAALRMLDEGDPSFAQGHLEALAGRWTGRVRALLRTIRRDAARIRADVASDLRALGPAVSRLERVDAALRIGLKRRHEAQDERLAELVGLSFARALEAMRTSEAFLAEPEATLVAAFAPRGWAARLAHEVERMLRAAYHEERTLLLELIGAAQRLRSDAEQRAIDAARTAPSSSSRSGASRARSAHLRESR